jgi:hypothetical protein
VVLILPIGGSAKNSLSVVSYRNFNKNADLENIIQTGILYFIQY